MGARPHLAMALPPAPEPWVADYVGTPYDERGRTRNGVDCWGLLCVVKAERFGVMLPAFEGLGYHDFAPGSGDRAARNEALAAFMASHMAGWRAVREADLIAGDAILLRQLGHPVHCGVVVARGWFLHIEEGIDAACEEWIGIKWRNRVVGFYRWEGAA